MPALPLLVFALLSGFHSPYCDNRPPATSDGIRAMDFCNFTYPGVRSYQYRKKANWPSARFTLTRGVRKPDDRADLITLEQIQYADVTRDHREEALITLTWHSGGTMQRHMVYIWTVKASTPVLLWGFSAGDRSDRGLYRVYADHGNLVVELNDPDAAIGNCCSRRFIRTRYRWSGKKFLPQGKPEVLPNHLYDDLKD